MGDGGQRANIGDFGQRIGGRLEEEKLGLGTNRRFPGRRIGMRHESGRDAGARQDVVEQLHGGTEQAVRGDDVVALLEMRQAERHDRRHAARRGNAVLGAFERGKARLEHAHGRVGEAGVNIAVFFTGETLGGLGGTLEDEARGQVQGFGMLAELAALLAGTDSKGFRTVVRPCLIEIAHQSWASEASCRTSCCEALPSPSSSLLPDLPPPRLPSTASR